MDQHTRNLINIFMWVFIYFFVCIAVIQPGYRAIRRAITPDYELRNAQEETVKSFPDLAPIFEKWDQCVTEHKFQEWGLCDSEVLPFVKKAGLEKRFYEYQQAREENFKHPVKQRGFPPMNK